MYSGTITGTTKSASSGESGGYGVYSDSGDYQAIIEDGTITGSAGGVYVNSGSFYMFGGEISRVESSFPRSNT